MIDRYDNAVGYLELTDEEKAFLFQNVNIFRGFLFSENDGGGRGFHDLYTWQDGYLPTFLQPVVNTMQRTEYSFSKLTHEMKKMNINTASISFHSRFASMDSEFKHEKENSKSSSKVSEYLLSQYIIHKCGFKTNFDRVRVAPAFLEEVENIVNKKEKDRMRCLELIELLNEWGYYVPQVFSLGGILYSETVTEVTDLEMAEKEKTDFSASFDTSFRQIGGGGAYGGSWMTEQKDSSSHKFENTALYQIGGAAGASSDYVRWTTSLYDAKRWNLSALTTLYPSLMLLLACEDGNHGGALLNTCLRLINGNLADKSIPELQPYIDLGRYASAITTRLYPY